MKLREIENRDSSIDILRGFAALTVVLGHLPSTPVVLVRWIYSFHMPLFFICSGMVFSAALSYREFFVKKFKTLVVPYFSLGICLWLLRNLMKCFLALMSGGHPLADWNIGNAIASLLLAHRLHEYYLGIWFLCTLFLAELIFYFVVKSSKQKIILPLLSVGGVVLQWFILEHVRGFYWSIDLVPVCLAFMSIGYMIKKCKTFHESICRIWLLPVALCMSIVCSYLGYIRGGQVDLCMSCMSDPFFFFLAAIAGSWTFMIISKHIGHVNPLIYFGRNSLITYIFQTSLTVPLAQELSGILARRFIPLSDSAFIWTLEFLTVLVLSFALITIINYVFPWMLGKQSTRKKERELVTA